MCKKQSKGKRNSEGESETIDINGVTYKVKREADKITLQRYNEKHKMWVNLHFPTGSQAEGKKIEDYIIQILSNLYIERNAIAPTYDALQQQLSSK